MSTSLAALLAAALSAAPASAAPARRVAVLDFGASWSSQCAGGGKLAKAEREQCEILRLFADEARGGALAVLRPPAFVVMTRENTAQILKDMGGQCTEGECEVETARLLGASVVVSGEVTLLEETWIVSLKVHDVATAALLGTGKTRAKTKLEAFDNVRAETEKMLRAAVALDGSVPVAASKPAEPVKPPPPPPPPPKKVDPEGLLVLDVGDEDAVVLVDGEKVGTGPLEKELKLLEGTHRVTVMKEGYVTFEKAYRVEVGGKVKAAPELVAVPAAAPAAPVASTASPSQGRRSWAELGVSVGTADPYVEPGDLGSAPAPVVRISGGHRLGPSLALQGTATVGSWPTQQVKDVAFRVGNLETLAVGLAWSVGGSCWFALTADVGLVRGNYQLAPEALPARAINTVGPFLGIGARADYALSAAWFVGARARVAVGVASGKLEVVSLTGVKAIVDPNPIFMPDVGAAIGYRF